MTFNKRKYFQISVKKNTCTVPQFIIGRVAVDSMLWIRCLTSFLEGIASRWQLEVNFPQTSFTSLGIKCLPRFTAKYTSFEEHGCCQPRQAQSINKCRVCASSVPKSHSLLWIQGSFSKTWCSRKRLRLYRFFSPWGSVPSMTKPAI